MPLPDGWLAAIGGRDLVVRIEGPVRARAPRFDGAVFLPAADGAPGEPGEDEDHAR